MVINFSKPLILLLIPLAICFIWYTAKYMREMQKLRKKLILILRNLVLLLLILALSGMELKWIVNTAATVFVVDASDSMKSNRQHVEEFVRNSIALKPNTDLAGVVAFGDNSLIESFVSKDAVFNVIETNPRGIYTNIENALTTAISLLPQNNKKRLVLITDGKENTGDSSKVAAALLEQGIDFKVLTVNSEFENEVAVEGINVPQNLRLGEQFSIVVNINSKINTSARLTLISGRDSVAEEKVELQKGINRFVFRDTAKTGGLKSYRVVIEPDVDTQIANNEASAIINVLDKPRILVIEDKQGEGDEIISILEASNMDYRKVDAEFAPATLQELAAYKTIISCNVSAENLNEGFLNSLEAYVKDIGGGFIAAGGEDSFALGGYYKTPLEKVLPVNMELKGNKQIPDMSIVLIIDKSGSMTEGRGGITRLDIAKEAAARTLDSLRPKDQIGVLTFDDTNYWVVETQKTENTEAIRDAIGTIRPGGGTSILPALSEGYESIKKTNTKIKHIILLTDGQAERTGYEELVRKIAEDNITVSTVAVGQGSDTQLLESIARGGNGRFYYTDEHTNIPRIFAKETFMAAKAYLNNREFTPAVNDSHPILSAVAEQGLPSLLGYVAASPKDTARVILSSDQQDPILTIWQYGLGKTAAWNSDVTGKWSANYAGWDGNAALWQNIINWTIEKYNQSDISVETSIEGGKGTVRLKSSNISANLTAEAVVISPSLESTTIILNPVAPGEYAGSFDIQETGGYLIKAQQKNAGEVVSAVNTGISVQYSPEYKIQPPSGTLDRLIKEAGGTLINTPEDVYKGKLKDIFGRVNLIPFLLIAALILFVMDIALRRLNLPFDRIEQALDKLKSKVSKKKEKPVMKTIKKAKPYKAEEEKLVEKAGANNNTDNEKSTIIKKKVKAEENNLNTSALLNKKKNRND